MRVFSLFKCRVFPPIYLWVICHLLPPTTTPPCPKGVMFARIIRVTTNNRFSLKYYVRHHGLASSTLHHGTFGPLNMLETKQIKKLNEMSYGLFIVFCVCVFSGGCLTIAAIRRPTCIAYCPGRSGVQHQFSPPRKITINRGQFAFISTIYRQRRYQ